MSFPSFFLLPCFRLFRRATPVLVYAHCENFLDLVAQFVALTLLWLYKDTRTFFGQSPLTMYHYICDLTADDVRDLKHGRVLSRIFFLFFPVRCKESKLLSLRSFSPVIKYCFCSVGHRLLYASHSLLVFIACCIPWKYSGTKLQRCVPLHYGVLFSLFYIFFSAWP